MTNLPLEPDDELRCLHCRQWHPVMAWHSEGTPYTLQMLYWKCAKGIDGVRSAGRWWTRYSTFAEATHLRASSSASNATPLLKVPVRSAAST
jgi:hypothetical protein